MKKSKETPVALLTMALAVIICAFTSASPLNAYASEGRERNATASYAEKRELSGEKPDYDRGFEFDSENGILIIKSEEGLDAVTAKDSGIDFLEIKKIVTADGLRDLSKPVFAGLPNLRELDLNKVENVAGFSFTLCENLETINAPELRTAGRHAFSNNNALRELYLPKLEKAEDAAFYNCTALYHADLPELKDIGMMAFASCGELRELDMKSAANIGGHAFAEDKSLSLVMPEHAPSVVNSAALNDVYELCIPEASEGYTVGAYADFPGKISIIADDLSIPEYVVPEKGEHPVTEFDPSGFGHDKYKVRLRWSPQSDVFEEDTKYTVYISIEDTGSDHFTLRGLDTEDIRGDKEDRIENISFDEENSGLIAEFYPIIKENETPEKPEEPVTPETPEEPERPDSGEIDPDSPGQEPGGGNGNSHGGTSGSGGKGESHNGEYAISGTWTCEGEGNDAKWRFSANGREFKDEWAYLINPYAKDPRYRASWFRFDASGIMLTGVYRDDRGNTYYLHSVSDGTLGRLETEGTAVLF